MNATTNAARGEQESMTTVGCTKIDAFDNLLTVLGVRHVVYSGLIHARMKLSKLQPLRDFVEARCSE